MSALPQNIDSFDPALVVEQNFARLFKASETMAGIVSRQFELGREYLAGNVSDFVLLSQARGPSALIDAEFEVMRRRSERTIAAVNTVTAQMQQAWAEAFDSGAPEVHAETAAEKP